MAAIRQPNITANTAEGQLSQIKNYLYRLTNELNFALKAAEDKEKKNRTLSQDDNKNGTAVKSDSDTANNTFLAVKNLIIKSADIVNAYYDVISQKLCGEYEALSDYGSFKETTEAFIVETSEKSEEQYSSIQAISDKLGNLSEIRKDNFYMRTGWLYEEEDGQKIGGVEIGQVSDDGNSTDIAFARFTTKELAFFDQNGTKLAWFAQYKLNIRDAKIEGNLELGGYILDTTNGIAFKWVGED